jgi:hypothetical protein
MKKTRLSVLWRASWSVEAGRCQYIFLGNCMLRMRL